MPTSIPDLPGWLVTLGASALTAIAGFILALVNRGPAMQTAINSAIAALNEGYKQRTDDLMAEVKELRKEVVELRKALDKTTGELHEARAARECDTCSKE